MINRPFFQKQVGMLLRRGVHEIQEILPGTMPKDKIGRSFPTSFLFVELKNGKEMRCDWCTLSEIKKKPCFAFRVDFLLDFF